MEFIVAFPRLIMVKMRISNFCHYLDVSLGRQIFTEYKDQVPELEENLLEIGKSIAAYTWHVYAIRDQEKR